MAILHILDNVNKSTHFPWLFKQETHFPAQWNQRGWPWPRPVRMSPAPAGASENNRHVLLCSRTRFLDPVSHGVCPHTTTRAPRTGARAWPKFHVLYCPCRCFGCCYCCCCFYSYDDRDFQPVSWLIELKIAAFAQPDERVPFNTVKQLSIC